MRLPKRSKRSSSKEKKDMLSLLQAVEQKGMNVTLSQLADTLLNLGCTRDLVRPLVPRVLAAVGPLLILAKAKEIVVNLARAAGLDTAMSGMNVTLSQLADALLNPGCTCDLVRPLVPRVLVVIGPLPILAKAKEIVVNLARAAGLDTAMSTLSLYVCNEGEHVWLTAIAVLDRIMCTIEAREVHQHLTCSTSSLANMMVELETIDEALGALKMA